MGRADGPRHRDGVRNRTRVEFNESEEDFLVVNSVVDDDNRGGSMRFNGALTAQADNIFGVGVQAVRDLLERRRFTRTPVIAP